MFQWIFISFAWHVDRAMIRFFFFFFIILEFFSLIRKLSSEWIPQRSKQNLDSVIFKIAVNFKFNVLIIRHEGKTFHFRDKFVQFGCSIHKHSTECATSPRKFHAFADWANYRGYLESRMIGHIRSRLDPSMLVHVHSEQRVRGKSGDTRDKHASIAPLLPRESTEIARRETKRFQARTLYYLSTGIRERLVVKKLRLYLARIELI